MQGILSSFALSFRWHRLLVGLLLSLCLLISGGCEANGRKADGVMHLTLWHGINPPPNRDVFQQLVDRFNQTHPDIQVDPIYIGQPDQQLPKILTAVVGNAAPDMLWFGPTITGQLVELGAIRPIEAWLDQSSVKSEIDPSLFEAMVLNGHTWSVPMATNNVGVFYRPSLFKDAGITQLPETWEELRQAAKQLTQDKNQDQRPDQHGMLLSLGKGEWTVFTWLPFMYSAGGELVQGKTPNLANSGAIAALQFWQDLVKDGSTVLSAPERGYELDNFIAGRVAMQVTGPWTLAQLQQSKIDFGVLPIPSQANRSTVVGGEHLFVMKTSPEREQAAAKFLEYVVGEDFQTGWSLGTGYLPINLKVRQSETYQAFVAEQPVLKVFLAQMQWARSRPIIAGYNRLSESLGRAIEATLLGASPQEALQTAQKRIELIWDNKA